MLVHSMANLLVLLAWVATFPICTVKTTTLHPHHQWGSILGKLLHGSQCTIIGMDMEGTVIKVSMSNETKYLTPQSVKEIHIK